MLCLSLYDVPWHSSVLVSTCFGDFTSLLCLIFLAARIVFQATFKGYQVSYWYYVPGTGKQTTPGSLLGNCMLHAWERESEACWPQGEPVPLRPTVIANYHSSSGITLSGHRYSGRRPSPQLSSSLPRWVWIGRVQRTYGSATEERVSTRYWYKLIYNNWCCACCVVPWCYPLVEYTSTTGIWLYVRGDQEAIRTCTNMIRVPTLQCRSLCTIFNVVIGVCNQQQQENIFFAIRNQREKKLFCCCFCCSVLLLVQ